MKIILFLAFSITIVLSSCTKDKTAPIVTVTGGCDEISYKFNIRPIIESSCKTQAGSGTGCHDNWIDDYSLIQSLLDASIIQTRVFVLNDMPNMPNTWGIDSLTSTELQTMSCWVDQGYPEN